MHFGPPAGARGAPVLWWGVPLSATIHAATIALALWGLPWLKVRPMPTLPAVTVTLVTPEDLAQLAAGTPAAAPEAASEAPLEVKPASVAEPAPAAPPVVEEATVPHVEAPAEAPPLTDFAPSFDPAHALGIPGLAPAPEPTEPAEAAPPPAAVLPEPPPRPRATDPAADPAPDPAHDPPAVSATRGTAGPRGDSGDTAATAVSVSSYRAAVRAAVERAKVYPAAARARGLVGRTQLRVRLDSGGQLLAVAIVGSSGSKLLDDASLAAVRNARMPEPPESLPRAIRVFDLGIAFTSRNG